MNPRNLIIIMSAMLFIVVMSGGVLSAECGNSPVFPCDVSISTTLNASIMNASNSNYAIRITADNVIFDCNNSLRYGNFSGVFINTNSRVNVTIINCNLSNFNNGITANQGYNNTIKNSIFGDMTNYAINIDRSRNIVIDNCSFDDSDDDSIYVYESNGILNEYFNITNSIFYNSRAFITVGGDYWNLNILNNVFHNYTLFGINLGTKSLNFSFIKNNVVFMKNQNDFFRLSNTYNSKIENNVFFGQNIAEKYAVFLSVGINNSVSNNVFNSASSIYAGSLVNSLIVNNTLLNSTSTNNYVFYCYNSTELHYSKNSFNSSYAQAEILYCKDITFDGDVFYETKLKSSHTNNVNFTNTTWDLEKNPTLPNYNGTIYARGIYLLTTNNNTRFDNCLFKNTSRGIYAQDQIINLTILNSQFFYNDVGVSIGPGNCENCNIEHNIFRDQIGDYDVYSLHAIVSNVTGVVNLNFNKFLNISRFGVLIHNSSKVVINNSDFSTYNFDERELFLPLDKNEVPCAVGVRQMEIAWMDYYLESISHIDFFNSSFDSDTQCYLSSEGNNIINKDITNFWFRSFSIDLIFNGRQVGKQEFYLNNDFSTIQNWYNGSFNDGGSYPKPSGKINNYFYLGYGYDDGKTTHGVYNSNKWLNFTINKNRMYFKNINQTNYNLSIYNLTTWNQIFNQTSNIPLENLNNYTGLLPALNRLFYFTYDTAGEGFESIAITTNDLNYSNTSTSITVTCSGSPGGFVGRLPSFVKGTYGYTAVYHNGVFVEYTNADTYTTTTCSTWEFIQTDYGTPETNPTYYISDYQVKTRTAASRFADFMPVIIIVAIMASAMLLIFKRDDPVMAIWGLVAVAISVLVISIVVFLIFTMTKYLV